MIPKDSTPIKNKILIDIIAKGLLSKDEMRIIFYIIRWSWGFNGVGRRQDWTKKITKRKIADDIGMYESHLNRTINKMIIENKIIIKGRCYQFNEHYEKWKNLPKSQVLKNGKKLTKLVSKTYQKVKVNLPKSQVKLTKKLSLGISDNQEKGIKNKDVRGGEHTSKETLKDNKENKDKIQNQPFKPLIREKRPANEIEFDFELWSWHEIDQDIKDRWAKIFPHIEVEIELNKMREFFKKHPEYEKIIKEKFNNNYAIYIFDWLARAEGYTKEDKEIRANE
jgi:hypothetical protein